MTKKYGSDDEEGGLLLGRVFLGYSWAAPAYTILILYL